VNDFQPKIDALKATIARQEAELADLQAEMLDIQQEFRTFVARYDRLIQPLAEKLDLIRQVIQDLENQRVGPTPVPDPPPPTPFDYVASLPPDHIPVEEQFRRTWRVPREAQREEIPPAPSVVQAANDAQPNLKQLYRKLVRRYHPDLSTDPFERERRTRLMVEINEAYTQRDTHALQVLLDQPAASTVEPLAALQLRQLQQVHDQLASRLVRLKQERDDFLNGEMMWLKIQASLAARQGRDLLREMAVQMEREYSTLLDRLDQLRRST
jgi:hypothetical protein